MGSAGNIEGPVTFAGDEKGTTVAVPFFIFYNNDLSLICYKLPSIILI
jgi:hypothetical protein